MTFGFENGLSNLSFCHSCLKFSSLVGKNRLQENNTQWLLLGIFVQKVFLDKHQFQVPRVRILKKYSHLKVSRSQNI